MVALSRDIASPPAGWYPLFLVGAHRGPFGGRVVEVHRLYAGCT